MLPDTVYEIYGFLSANEAQLLYQLAAEVPAQENIVEIGSFQGKSTVCLGLGAKQNGARVYAIDPHEDWQVNQTTHYGMENHAALLKHLVDFEVAQTVRVVALPSQTIVDCWHGAIALLWVDGSHEFNAVWADLISWSPYVNGKIAIHDSSGHFPAVSKALQMFLMDNGWWKVCQTVDATTVLERTDV